MLPPDVLRCLQLLLDDLCCFLMTYAVLWYYLLPDLAHSCYMMPPDVQCCIQVQPDHLCCCLILPADLFCPQLLYDTT